MVTLDTIETEVDRLSALCTLSRSLTQAGAVIASTVIAELEEEASLVLGGIVGQIDQLRSALLERDAEWTKLLGEHEAAALLLCRGIPRARRVRLADLVSARAEERAAAVLEPTGR